MSDRRIININEPDYFPEPPHDRFDGALLCALCSLTSAIAIVLVLLIWWVLS